jgi:hypothetical protein
MLPGFRFLFGALVLSMSILVFGFGAAALLRTAHEEFASAPAWRPAPETRFAQSQETPATQPVLALLRVDDAPKETVKDAAKDPIGDTLKDADKAEPQASGDVAAEPAAAPSPQPEPDKTAALQPSDAPAATAPEAAPPQAEAPATTDQTKLAAVAQPSTDTPAPITTAVPAPEAAPPPAAEAAPAAAETVTAPAPATFSTRIATLGGPPVTIVSPKAESAKPDRDRERDRDAVRKRQAHRAAHRRRISALRLQQQHAVQQQANPFGQAPVGQNPAR